MGKGCKWDGMGRVREQMRWEEDVNRKKRKKKIKDGLLMGGGYTWDEMEKVKEEKLTIKEDKWEEIGS